MMTREMVVLSEQEAYEQYDRILYSGRGREVERRALRMPPFRAIRPDGGGDCTYYAIANLYTLCGLEPPSIDAMRTMVPREPGGGVALQDGAVLLIETGFPGLVSYGSLPMCETWRDFLPRAFGSGRLFILAYQGFGRIDGEVCEIIGDREFEGIEFAQVHAIVPFECDGYGVKVITSWHDRAIELLNWELFPTMPIHAWRTREDMDFRSRRGILRDFVMVERLSDLA